MAALSAALFIAGSAFAQGNISAEMGYMKKMPPPDSYGTLIMNKNTGDAMAAVVFPHWLHRAKFACKVCHTDIGFAMKAKKTEFMMADNFSGNYCGKCHNGDTAFATTECNRCHSYGTDTVRKKIENELKGLPKDEYGNKVNWVTALRDGKIKPKASLEGGEMAAMDLDIIIKPMNLMPRPPDVLYPHKAHTEVLDCSSCHTSIFEMQQGGHPAMSMQKIIAGQYCGVCHGKVAFPLDDCFRCHSQFTPFELPKEKPADAKKDAATDTKK